MIAPQASARIRLDTARLVGASTLAVLGQFAVSAPGSYFGTRNEATPLGLVFSAAAILITGAAIAGMLRRRPWGHPLALLVLSLNAAAFVPPLASDPVLSGAVVAWQAVLLARLLFPRSHEPALPTSLATDDADRWLAVNGPAARHLTVVALVVALLVLGFEIGSRLYAWAVCATAELLAVSFSARLLTALLRAGRRTPLLAVVLIAAALATAARPSLSLALGAGALAVVLVLLMRRLPILEEIRDYFYGYPALLVLASFATLIAVGTVLLSFPIASSTGAPLAPVDALFTATSATCVTGLIVVDTPTAFSSFGHAVILFLIQVGGLNIMVLSTFAALLLGYGLGLRGERALGEVLDAASPRSARQLIVFIVASTVAVEAAGAAMLLPAFLRHGQNLPQAAWHGVFHSVSAFCNAGFALQTDSLVGFQGDPWVLLVMAGLIVLGGLGFSVLAVPWLRIRGFADLGSSTHVRVVLTTSAVLLIVGAGWYAAAEWNRSLAGLEPLDRLVNAAFQSVTLRTAGFNSVSFAALHPVTILMMLVWMFVGASPGGTGGGIKTTTAAILVGTIPALASGRPQVLLFKRRVSAETVYRAAVTAVIGILLVFATAALLLATQGDGFIELVFEAVSAFGTVGLSLGSTARLDTVGKVVITATMLAGRVGPLALALLLVRRRLSSLGYPEARILVG